MANPLSISVRVIIRRNSCSVMCATMQMCEPVALSGEVLCPWFEAPWWPHASRITGRERISRLGHDGKYAGKFLSINKKPLIGHALINLLHLTVFKFEDWIADVMDQPFARGQPALDPILRPIQIGKSNHLKHSD